MDRDKLAEIRRKVAAQKAEKEATRHKELLQSQESVKEAVDRLYEVLNDNEPYDDTKLIEQIGELKQSLGFKDEIKALERAIKETKADSVSIKNIDELVTKFTDIQSKSIHEALTALTERINQKTTKQAASDYIPTRRVRMVGSRLIYDDEPLQVTVTGGGGGGGIQQRLIRNSTSIAVVNPDGTPISSGGGSTPTIYKKLIDETTTLNVTYIGEAALGTSESAALWRIQRIDETSGVAITWSGTGFTVAWDERALTVVYT